MSIEQQINQVRHTLSMVEALLVQAEENLKDYQQTQQTRLDLAKAQIEYRLVKNATETLANTSKTQEMTVTQHQNYIETLNRRLSTLQKDIAALTRQKVAMRVRTRGAARLFETPERTRSGRTFGGVGGGGGIGVHYDRIPYPGLLGVTTDLNSVANRAFATPKMIHFRCRVDRLGLMVGTARVNGNVELGLYGPYPSWARVCLTNPIAVAGMTAARWEWYTPTTTPTIESGLYWAVMVCDTVYSAGVSGLQFRYTGNTFLIDVMDLEVDGIQLAQRMDGAYPLPDPLVPVNHSNQFLLGVSPRLTVV